MLHCNHCVICSYLTNIVTVATMTLDSKALLKEGWLTLYKGKKTGLFNSKLAVSLLSMCIMQYTCTNTLYFQ